MASDKQKKRMVQRKTDKKKTGKKVIETNMKDFREITNDNSEFRLKYQFETFP